MGTNINTAKCKCGCECLAPSAGQSQPAQAQKNVAESIQFRVDECVRIRVDLITVLQFNCNSVDSGGSVSGRKIKFPFIEQVYLS